MWKEKRIKLKLKLIVMLFISVQVFIYVVVLGKAPGSIINELFWFSMVWYGGLLWHIVILQNAYKFVKGDKVWGFLITRVSIITSLTFVLFLLKGLSETLNEIITFDDYECKDKRIIESDRYIVKKFEKYVMKKIYLIQIMQIVTIFLILIVLYFQNMFNQTGLVIVGKKKISINWKEGMVYVCVFIVTIGISVYLKIARAYIIWAILMGIFVYYKLIPLMKEAKVESYKRASRDWRNSGNGFTWITGRKTNRFMYVLCRNLYLYSGNEESRQYGRSKKEWKLIYPYVRYHWSYIKFLGSWRGGHLTDFLYIFKYSEHYYERLCAYWLYHYAYNHNQEYIPMTLINWVIYIWFKLDSKEELIFLYKILVREDRRKLLDNQEYRELKIKEVEERDEREIAYLKSEEYRKRIEDSSYDPLTKKERLASASTYERVSESEGFKQWLEELDYMYLKNDLPWHHEHYFKREDAFSFIDYVMPKRKLWFLDTINKKMCWKNNLLGGRIEWKEGTVFVYYRWYPSVVSWKKDRNGRTRCLWKEQYNDVWKMNKFI